MDICSISRFESWGRPLWGFWLFGGSRSCPIVKKCSRKYSGYQDYYGDTPAAHFTNQRHAAARLPQPPAKIERKWYLFWWKNHISNCRSPSEFAIWMKTHPYSWKLTRTIKFMFAGRFFRAFRSEQIGTDSRRGWRKAVSLVRLLGTWRMMMMIAFITIKSSLVPLIEGLCAQIYFRFEISVVCSHFLLFFFVKEKTC